VEGYLAGLGSGERVEVRLLTPLALQDGDDSLLMRQSEEMYFSRLRRYRAWRTGHYYAPCDPDAQDGFVPVGLDREENVPRGAESTPVLGVPEGSRFRFSVREETRAELCAELARAFIEGDGNPAWTYLGWGQVVMA
jgi:hypothetical protein